jgi:hypothetical protein
MPTRSPSSLLHFLGVLLPACSTASTNRALDYVREENRVLREMIVRRRLRFTDGQRRRLAIAGRELGRRLLEGVATLVTPDTILAWHRPAGRPQVDARAACEAAPARHEDHRPAGPAVRP